MPTDYRFSRRAAERLTEIATWTQSTFGPTQAERYETLLIDRLTALVEGRAQPRPLSRLTGAAHHDALMTLKVGRHLLILLPEPDTWVVIDILHDAQNLTTRDFDQEES
ncbi:Plasmid stabilization system protein [Roseovarius tolerans]|uniref:Plasmid stabilization system protein n=1 Tax=Roseovarius tolerans TaxID=74031 RepID=A0A0L6CX40_9RHOB|nr:type II toxin-antitoxin system RelE/ParE family toxin [Roseovarius tolerans]KNX42331.1 Plasmid stabilization system protein [Roseovarius tolerans]